MTATRKLTITLAAIALVNLMGLAPSWAQPNGSGGIFFQTGVPRGELDDRLGRDAYGLGGQVFYSPTTMPVALGLDVSWVNYGNENREEPFSTTIPDVTVGVDTSNNFVQGLLVLRAQSPGRVSLYADALAGLNYLFTSTSIHDLGWGDDVISHTNQDDAAFAYGYGGGVQVAVWSNDMPSDFIQRVSVDAGVRYVKGGEATYLKEGSIRRSDGAVEYSTIRSRTDMMKIHLGVTLQF